MKLDERSNRRMVGVHPDLVRVVCLAAVRSDLEFVVTEGVRTPARQKELYDAGASKTLNSRHIPGADGLGKAVDLAVKLDGEIRWDWPLYHKLADVMKDAALDLKIPIVCGADWKSFPDGPHFELSKKEYP